MTKVTDFHNTWCEATEEARNLLKQFSYPALIREEIGSNVFRIYPSDDTVTKKQIHLVDGEFYYVEDLPMDTRK